MIGIIDYGMGNLLSAAKAFEHCGGKVKLLRDPGEAGGCRVLVLPGVGAFGDAMAGLREKGWTEAIPDSVGRGLPLVGICLGMQLLFTRSEEGGEHEGLNLIPGRVVRFGERPGLHVPHMGWNQLEFPRPDELFAGVRPGEFVYFVHSFYPVTEDERDVAAWADYGGKFAAAVSRGNVYGMQFHPEKSQAAGLRIVKNCLRLGGKP